MELPASDSVVELPASERVVMKDQLASKIEMPVIFHRDSNAESWRTVDWS